MSGESVNFKFDGEVRFDYNSKMKTSPLMESSKEKIGLSCRDDNVILSNYSPVISSVISASRPGCGPKRNLTLK